ncbi:MAG: lysophospholipase [Acidimicrobiia bacterium]
MPSTSFAQPHPKVGTQLVREWNPDGEAKATIVLVHGHAEHSGRYDRTGTLLARAGYFVRSFDLIGAGATGGPRWDTADWEDFHDQLQGHMEWARDQGRPVVLMGHSTGGTIVISYLVENRPHPDLVVLTAPLIELRPTWQMKVLPILFKVAPKMWIPAPTKVEDLSRDPAVGEAYDADPLVSQGGTVRFGKALLDEMERVKSAWHEIDVPTLVLHGGQDVLVPTEGSAPMAELPTVERQVYPDLRHEILNEPEGPQVIGDIVVWLNAHI